jgi:hypothetical protein
MTDTVDTLVEEAPPLAEAPAEPIVQEGYCDYMVVFADEDEAYSVLYDSATDDEGNVTLTPKFIAVDMIGTIYEPAPDPVPENYKPLPYTGYHANVRNIGPAPELDAFVVNPTPVTPLRVWA